MNKIKEFLKKIVPASYNKIESICQIILKSIEQQEKRVTAIQVQSKKTYEELSDLLLKLINEEQELDKQQQRLMEQQNSFDEHQRLLKLEQQLINQNQKQSNFLCQEIYRQNEFLKAKVRLLELEHEEIKNIITKKEEFDDKTMIKVSVIIPTYNTEKYLEQCLQSILNQTLKDIEIICVDDGSTDMSLAILNQYAISDDRLIVLANEKKGVSAARNLGATVAHGEYIYFMDSDDYIELETLEYLYNEAKENRLEVLFFDGESFYDSIDLQRNPKMAECCYRGKEYNDIYSGQELYVKMRQDGAYKPMIWLQLISKKYYQESRLSFREGILYEDVIFSASCILQAKRVSHRKKVFYHYRRRDDSITTSKITFAHVYGRMIGLLEFIYMMDKISCSEDVKNETLKGLEWMRREIIDNYGKLSANEKEKRKEMNAVERAILSLLLGEL